MKERTSKLIEIQKLDLSEFDLPSLQNLTNEISNNIKTGEFKKNIRISISSNYTTSFITKILNVFLINILALGIIWLLLKLFPINDPIPKPYTNKVIIHNP